MLKLLEKWKMGLILVCAVLFSAACMAEGTVYPDAGERRQSPGNTPYYIDPVKGDDSATGEKNSPWKSFTPLNKLVLKPGDRVEVVAPGPLTSTLYPAGGGTARQPVVIRFAPGKYDWMREDLLTRKLMISNTNDDPNGDKAIAMELKDLNHVRIEGAGARFLCRGKMVEVHLDRSQNIRLSGFAFDYKRPTVSEYTVDKLAPDHALLTVHKDSDYRIENGKLKWIGEGWEADPGGYGQKLTRAPLRLVRSNSPLGSVDSVEELSKGKLKVTFGNNPGFEEGATFQHRNTRRDCVGVFCNNSENIIWDRVQFHFIHGMGVVSQFSKNLAFLNVRMAPAKDSGRTCSAWADMLHFSGCGGKLLFDGIYFSGSNDDAINVHGTHLRIEEILAPRKLKVRFMHPQTYGFEAFRKGDEVEFIHRKTLLPFGSAKVSDAEMSGEKDMILTLDKDIPKDRLEEGDVLENVTWTPSVHVKNCFVEANPCRGFLLTTRRPVIVENTTFNRMGMRGILVSDDASSWFESGMVKDLTIRNNTFIDCEEPVIDIHPENPEAREGEPVHSNIKIQNNTFYMKGNRAVFVKSADNVLVDGNTIYSAEGGKKAEDFVHKNAATNVKVGKNEVKSGNAPVDVAP